MQTLESTKSSDVYSFGIIYYEIFNKSFENLNFFEKVENGFHQEINESFPIPFKYLIANCISQDPSKRSTFSEIKE